MQPGFGTNRQTGNIGQTVESLNARIHQLEAELAESTYNAALQAKALAEIVSELRTQTMLLRILVDESPDLILVKDHIGNFVLGNKRIADLYGTTPEAMAGKNDGDFSATPEQTEFYRQNVTGIMARGLTEIVYETATDNSNGKVRQYRSTKTPFKGADGLSRILVIAHEIQSTTQA